VRYRPDGTALPMIAIPTFGYKSHIVIDRRYGFIRKSAATSAAHSDGRMLPKIVTTDNTSSNVWADSAYRSKANEAWLSSKVLRSQIHRRKPKGGPMSVATSRANGKKSSIRARVEHVFAHQKKRYGLFSRTIGLVRTSPTIWTGSSSINAEPPQDEPTWMTRNAGWQEKWSLKPPEQRSGGCISPNSPAAT